jgi:poly(A) polymerase
MLAELLQDGSEVMRLAQCFVDAGHEIYLVGGPVRDGLLGRPSPNDLDFATSAEPPATLDILRPMARAVWEQGVRYGTVGAEVEGTRVEITTFRTERYQPSSRHPEVRFAADIETDLSRRDFTVNAMAIRLPDKVPIDPHGGMEDLKAKLLRTPIDAEDSFADDPLRMLRAFRFASQLGFKIDRAALDAISALKDELKTISAERIRDELSRLVVGQDPARALRLADSTGLTDLFLPELSALKLEQDPLHRHKDVFQHTLTVMERTDPILELRLAALLHDIGKPRTRKIGEGGVSFHHHEILGAKMAVKRLKELRFSNDVVETVGEVIRLHHRFHGYGEEEKGAAPWTDSAVRRYVRDAGPHLDKLNAMVRADCTTRNEGKARRLKARMDDLEERIERLAEEEELAAMRPGLDGHQVMAFLGVPPGPVIGEAHRFLMDVRMDEGEIAEDEAYARLDAWARDRGLEPSGERVPPKPRKKEE